MSARPESKSRLAVDAVAINLAGHAPWDVMGDQSEDLAASGLETGQFAAVAKTVVERKEVHGRACVGSVQRDVGQATYLDSDHFGPGAEYRRCVIGVHRNGGSLGCRLRGLHSSGDDCGASGGVQSWSDPFGRWLHSLN
jgi:hypothetical protein